VNIKIIVAYSSVVYINFMMSSLFSLLKVGILGTIGTNNNLLLVMFI